MLGVWVTYFKFCPVDLFAPNDLMKSTQFLLNKHLLKNMGGKYVQSLNHIPLAHLVFSTVYKYVFCKPEVRGKKYLLVVDKYCHIN